MSRSKLMLLSIEAWVLAAVVSAEPAWPLSLDDVLIDRTEVDAVCETIEGEHPVSIQPGVQYQMAGDGEAGIAIYGDPRRKLFQSFSCEGTKATVYYYEYGSRKEVEGRLDSIKTILWGEKGPTRLHPELVLDIDNILIVVSSREPDFIAKLLAHRTAYPDLDNSVVDDRLRALRCGSEKETSRELCSALLYFKNGNVPEELFGDEFLLFGQSWEVSKSASPGQAIFEVLYVGQIPGRGPVASFGAIEPENEDERAQIFRQMKAQASGEVAHDAGPLLAFARDAFGRTKAQARRVGNRSFAFIGMGNRVYLRRSGTRLILTTGLMHDAKQQPFVVAVFNAKPASGAIGP